MSSESRVLRPFNIDERLEEVLSDVVFSYSGLQCTPGGRVLVEDRSFGLRSPVLEWAPEPSFAEFKRDLALGATTTGLDKSLLCLAVTARSGYLKLCELVYCRRLDDLEGLGRVVRLDERPGGSRREVFRAARHGAVIDAYVALHRGVEPAPLRPSRVGAWLAHASFRIECESDSELFRPMPLDDKNRNRLKLRASTSRFLELEGTSLAEPLANAEVPTLWVDEQLLGELDRMSASAVARHLQAQLALEVIGGVIFEFARLASGAGDTVMADDYRDATYDAVKDSLIGRIARLVAGPGATDSQRDLMLRTCRDNPRLVVAWAEEAVGLRAAALKSLEQ